VRRRALLLASAASATVIVGGWQLGSLGAVTAPVADGAGTQAVGSTTGSAGSTDAAASGSTDSGAGSTGTGTGTDTTAPSTTETDAATAAAASDGTWAGSTVTTRFGDVQVQVTISGGAVTDVTALQLTDHDNRSVQISNRAAPILRDEVLQAQSSSVSFVSGATYTSAAYLQSLQAALDEAGF
jgi:uncharacterized protein with FMN-binding domain